MDTPLGPMGLSQGPWTHGLWMPNPAPTAPHELGLPQVPTASMMFSACQARGAPVVSCCLLPSVTSFVTSEGGLAETQPTPTISDPILREGSTH